MRAVEVWRFFRSWLGRIRSVSTPLGGVSWDPHTPDRAPLAEPTDEEDVSAETSEFDDHPSDEEVEILTALGNATDHCLELEEISRAVDLSHVRARHHLDNLEHPPLQLVDHTEDPMYGYVYSLTLEGRKFVIEHDLDD